jgi:hypothetical protein
MKAKRRKALRDKKARIAAGTNNGWMNFVIESTCKTCDVKLIGSFCAYRESPLTEEKGCAKEAYLARKEGREPRF